MSVPSFAIFPGADFDTFFLVRHAKQEPKTHREGIVLADLIQPQIKCKYQTAHSGIILSPPTYPLKLLPLCSVVHAPLSSLILWQLLLLL
jgi:hypothetical protein